MIISGILLSEKDYQKEALANEAFRIEYETQGLGSPIDTTTISAGGFVLTNGRDGIPLWKIERNGISWNFSSIPTRNLEMVVVYSGSKGSTREQVAKVKKFYDRGSLAKDIMKRIGNITEEGVRAVMKSDVAKIGELMIENHSELKIFGISTDPIEKIVSIGREYGYGSKLTGAGGGGAVIIIPRDKEKLMKKLKELNVIVFDTSTTGAGIFKRSE